MQPKPYRENELEFKVLSMTQLQELRDSIKELYVQLPLEAITPGLVEELTRRVKKSKGKTILRFTVLDREAQVSLNLFSKSCRVDLTQSLIGFLDDNSLQYSIA